MMENQDRGHDGTYGPWAWIAGMAAGAAVIWLMFALAQGFA